MILGASQAGKTKFAEHAFRTTRLMSIFVDSKGDARRGKLAGAPVINCPGERILDHALVHGKVIWAIPEADRMAEFTAMTRRLHRVADRVGRPFCDLFVDEIQQYSAAATTVRGDKYGDAVLEKAASEILGLGVRIRGLTQRVVGFHPLFRENSRSAIVFQVTHEGAQGVGWPFKDWKKHLAKPYHFVEYDGVNTRLYRPVPVA